MNSIVKTKYYVILYIVLDLDKLNIVSVHQGYASFKWCLASIYDYEIFYDVGT